MNPTNCSELTDKLTDDYLQVLTKYIKLDVIKDEICNYLSSIESKIEILIGEPDTEIIPVLQLIIFKDLEDTEQDYSLKEYQHLYDLYDEQYLGEYLTAGFMSVGQLGLLMWDDDRVAFYKNDINHTVYDYFKYKFVDSKKK